MSKTTPMNMEKARFNMIENQIRPWRVFDQAILDLLATTPREDFVPAVYKQLAFADMSIPLGCGQVMMQPKEEGRLVQALKLKPTETVWEVGTGSGYLTALLAKLSLQVDSIEIFPELSQHAALTLKNQGIKNVSLIIGDALKGWQTEQQYDVIVLTGSLATLPLNVQTSLKPGGRLFVILGNSPSMNAFLLQQNEHNEWQKTLLFQTDILPLISVTEPNTFKF